MPSLPKAQIDWLVIVLLDTSHDLVACKNELGCDVEELFTPLTNRNPKNPDGKFAIDNGAFSKFDSTAFLKLLKKHDQRKLLCRFVAVPDVVGSSRRTIEAFNFWSPKIDGWPKAFVCQDGQETDEIPWLKCDAIFIGGSTEWKLSKHAAAIVKACAVFDKWCHVGRINTPGRFEYFRDLGADSCDGTGLARYSHMRKAIYERDQEPDLFKNLSNNS